MADEFNTTSNWWDSSSRYSTGSSSSSSSSSAAAAAASSSYIGWPITAAYHNNHHQNQMMDIKSVARSSLDSPASVSSGSSVDHLHMMGLALDWNQTALLRGGEKSDQGSFRSTLQQDSNNNLNSTSGYRGFSLDQFSPHGNCSSDSSSVTCCQGLPSSCFSPLDSSSATNLYGNNNSNNNAIYQVAGMLGSENQNYHYAAAAGAAVSSSYGMNANTTELLPSWSAAATNNKVPQFLRNSANSSSPPKPPPQHLQFSNNAPFWNASAGGINDVRSPNFFPMLQAPYAATQCAYDEIKPNNRHHHASDHQGVRNTAAKKSSSSGSEQQPTSKRAKNDQTTSSLPAFKVRKEKMGDRITALQQLVSPFGKTDTASVLSEAIEYIKFLHEQVAVLSTPYMKSGVPIPHQQNLDKGKESEGEKQDLRSRGLCLVPVSSTFPVTQETTVDFWTPTFGGTFR